ncbi:MAG: hypothetical protein R2932_16125 [Caldilineaceae bacterium]
MTSSLTTPTLQTPRLRLRPFTETDKDVIYALMSNAHTYCATGTFAVERACTG